MSWRDDKIIEQAPAKRSWRDDEILEYGPDGPPEEQPVYTEKQRRIDFGRYKKELALASEAKKSGESYLPGFRSYAVQAGAPLVAGVARYFNQQEFADQMTRTAAASEQIQREQEKGGVIPDWLQRAFRGAGISLTQAAALGMLTGPKGIIGAFSASEGNRAWTEGADAGLEGKELAEYVLKQATIEAVPALISQKLFGGLNVESILGRGAKQAVAKTFGAGAKQAAKTMVVEQIEEGATELGHLVASTKIDPNALSAESIKQTAFETFTQTLLMGVAATTPGVMAARKRGKMEKARGEILEASESDRAPSERQWKSWGLDPKLGKNRAMRTEGVREIAATIKAAEAEQAAPQIDEAVPAAPETAAEAPPAAEPPVETPGAPEATEQAPVDAVKEPWQMSKSEYTEQVSEPKGDGEWEVFKSGKATVVRNPKDSDIRDMSKAYLEDNPGHVAGTPKTRSTIDENGNKYTWRADHGMHGSVESTIQKRYGVKSNQNGPDVEPHSYAVRRALEEGKPVPAEVLAEYPALQQPAPAGAADTAPVSPEVKRAPAPAQTSIANVPVAEQRAARGEDALPDAEPTTHKQLLVEGQRLIATTPSLPGRLVAELNEKSRTLSDVETAVLQVEYRTLTDEFDEVSDALFKAQEGGRKLAIAEAQEKTNEVIKELDAIERVAKKTGTEAGRSLAARAMTVRPDFTLGSVVRRLRVAKGGKELSALQMAKAKKISEEALAVEAEQESLGESIEAQDSEAGIDRIIERSKKKTFQKRAVERKAAASEKVKAAMAEFKAKLAEKKPDGGVGGLLAGESGAVDVELMASGANLVVAYAELGVSTFVEFYANVQSQLGIPRAVSNVRDSLRAAWVEAQKAGLIAIPEVDPNDTQSMSRFAKKIARLVVESGVTSRDELVDAVHEELQSISPDIDRRGTMDAISGYGIYTELSKDEASMTLRDLSGQLRQLSKLEDIQSGKEPKDTGVEHRKQSEEELELVRQVREARRASGFGEVDDVARTEAYKRMLTKKVADLERRIAEGDFTKPAKRKTKLDADATALKYKAHVLRKRLGAMEERFKNSQLKGFKKLYRYAGESSNLGRAMKTAFDLSGLLRQGKLAAAANPKMIKKSIVSMIRAYWSKELAFNDAEAVRNHPDAARAAEGGLATTEPEGRLTEQEEVFRGEWAKYIPGVAGAERAYAAGLNSLRMDYFSQLLRDIEAGGLGRESGKATAAEVKAIANVVNVFTGRGSFSGQNQAAAQFLSTYFFSPRFVASRFQFLAGQPFYQGSMRSRKLIAREYGRAMGSMSTIYALAAIGGYFLMGDDEQPKFEWDPRSTEAFKVRFGGIVWDPAAGLGQIVTFGARIAPDWMGGGMTKTSTGEIVPIRGPDVPFAGTTVLDVWVRLFQSKLAPLPAALLNANVGKNVIGEETDLVHELLTLPIPLSFGDVYDALQADGYSAKAALATLALFGDGVNRYQNANAAKFAKKITRNPNLEGYSKTTGEWFSYTEAVEQIVAEAKKRGITLDQLIKALDEEMRAAGKSTKSIRGKKKLLRRRVSS